MIKIEKLQKKYPKFVYENYSYKILNDDLIISFRFQIEHKLPFMEAKRLKMSTQYLSPTSSVRGAGRVKMSTQYLSPQDICFKPKIIIKNVNKSQIERVGERVLNSLVFHLGLIEMLSYWKSTCSPEIEIQAGFLSREQIGWWKDLTLNGMGQFFFENKINFLKPDFLKISAVGRSVGKEKIDLYRTRSRNDKVLVAVGGGKDSIVTLEILKKAGKSIGCFSLNPTATFWKIVKIAHSQKNIIAVNRVIDDKLLDLNRKGFLNGHTPFSAYLAFLSLLLAVIFDFKYLMFSNERSSNEGNVKYLGKIINHQYSKSFDFEEKFRSYYKKYLTKDIEYFSFLRPLYEIQIAKLFSEYSKYFSVFLSCNEAHKTGSGIKKTTGRWCGKCPKCLFVFSVLYPFVDKNKLLKIFGKNLFNDKKLLPVMQELIGERGFKPLECVGTKEESLVTLYLSSMKCDFISPTSLKKREERLSENLPYLLNYFEKKILTKHNNLAKKTKKFLNSWADENCLPKSFSNILKNNVGKLEK